MSRNEQIIELHSKGLTDSEISSQLSMHRQTVGEIRRRLKLPVNEAHSEYKKSITNLVKEGLSDADIARKLNISDKTVFYVRKKLDLKTKHPHKIYHNPIDKRKGYWLRNLKFSALQRNLEFALTIEDFDLPKYCPILGIELLYGKVTNGYNNATLDRIDNKKGYVKGNVIVMSRRANMMKYCADFDELQLFANNIQKLINHYKDRGALANITDVFPDIEFYQET